MGRPSVWSRWIEIGKLNLSDYNKHNFVTLDNDYCYHKEPCRNGATCHPNGSNNYTCICQEGFTGRDCEISKPSEFLIQNLPIFSFLNFAVLSPCAHNPCQNFGTCLDMYTHYQCQCPQMYTGPRCEHRKLKRRNIVHTWKLRFNIILVMASEKWYPCYDAETEIHYPHGAHWDTLSCKHCTCLDGYSRCSSSRCSTNDCLSRTSYRRQICPEEQVGELKQKIKTNKLINFYCSGLPFCPKPHLSKRRLPISNWSVQISGVGGKSEFNPIMRSWIWSLRHILSVNGIFEAAKCKWLFVAFQTHMLIIAFLRFHLWNKSVSTWRCSYGLAIFLIWLSTAL